MQRSKTLGSPCQRPEERPTPVRAFTEPTGCSADQICYSHNAAISTEARWSAKPTQGVSAQYVHGARPESHSSDVSSLEPKAARTPHHNRQHRHDPYMRASSNRLGAVDVMPHSLRPLDTVSVSTDVDESYNMRRFLTSSSMSGPSSDPVSLLPERGRRRHRNMQFVRHCCHRDVSSCSSRWKVRDEMTRDLDELAARARKQERQRLAKEGGDQEIVGIGTWAAAASIERRRS